MKTYIVLMIGFVVWAAGCASRGQNNDMTVDSQLGILRPVSISDSPDESLRAVQEQTYKDRDQNIQRDITDPNVS